MRTLVLGAGATGGYFGGRLAEAGREVAFLVRGARGAELARDGLRIESPRGNVELRPRLLLAEELPGMEPFDLILLTAKAYSLRGALEELAPVVGEGTTLLPILNGMRHLDWLVERFGRERVLGGSCRIVADVRADGVVEQRTTLGELWFGELPGAAGSDRMARIAAELSVPGFEALPTETILAVMWQKWWILSSLGAICVLGRGTIGQVVRAPYGPQLVEAVLAECTALAGANGFAADPGMLADHRERLADAGSTLTSSMYRDMMRGAPVEADHVLGDLLSRGRGTPAPLLAAAYTQLKVYEAGRG